MGPVTAGATITLDVDQLGLGLTAAATAVAVTITAVDSAGGGFVTAWPAGATRPEVSNLNVSIAGPAVANFAIVPVAADGRFSLSPSMATNLIVDLAGVYVAVPASSTGVAAGRTLAVTPTRLLDTRNGTQPAAHSSLEVTIGGAAGVPVAAAAAVVTVTAVDAGSVGYVTVWPAGTARPEVSSLNVGGPGETVANLALVPLGGGGKISLYTDSPAHLLVDVVGYVTAASANSSTQGLFVAVGPTACSTLVNPPRPARCSAVPGMI